MTATTRIPNMPIEQRKSSAIASAAVKLAEVDGLIDFIIMATPSGAERDQWAVANILFKQALAELAKAGRMRPVRVS